MSTDDEADLRRLWDGGEFGAVTTLAFERYGAEILGGLAARLRSESEAREVFSIFAEDLWGGRVRISLAVHSACLGIPDRAQRSGALGDRSRAR